VSNTQETAVELIKNKYISGLNDSNEQIEKAVKDGYRRSLHLAC
jgi:hypothetical protein